MAGVRPESEAHTAHLADAQERATGGTNPHHLSQNSNGQTWKVGVLGANNPAERDHADQREKQEVGSGAMRKDDEPDRHHRSERRKNRE